MLLYPMLRYLVRQGMLLRVPIKSAWLLLNGLSQSAYPIVYPILGIIRSAYIILVIAYILPFKMDARIL